MTTVDRIPFFLQANTLKPYVTEELLASTWSVRVRGLVVGQFDRAGFAGRRGAP